MHDARASIAAKNVRMEQAVRECKVRGKHAAGGMGERKRVRREKEGDREGERERESEGEREREGYDEIEVAGFAG